jgi:hypothetical protein
MNQILRMRDCGAVLAAACLLMFTFFQGEIGATGDEDLSGPCQQTFDCAALTDPTECSQGTCEPSICGCQYSVKLNRCRCQRVSLPA